MAIIQIKICEGCGEEFENLPGKNGRVNPKKRHCTQKCWLRRHNVLSAQHAIKGGRIGGQRNGERTRGTTKSSGNAYVKEKQRHQHRVVAERLIGRPLTPGEVVHHEDHNRKNNSPENLLVFPSQAEHARHHGRGHTEGRNLPCDCTTIKKLT